MNTSTLLTIVTVALFLVSCTSDDPAVTPDNPIELPSGECFTSSGGFPEYLELPPVGDNGSYDPTLAGDPTTGVVWMIFSRVDGRGGEGQVSTHLAFSQDNGQTWCYAMQINVSEKVSNEELPDEYKGAVSAHWSHEVPSIAYFPEAPVNKQWRILWHRYLHVDDGVAGNDDREFAYGWIATKTASNPLLLADAPEEKLFSTGGYYKDEATTAYNDAILGVPEVNVQRLHSDLGQSLVLSEPGMQAYAGKLYVSLVSAHPTFGTNIILLSATSSGTWSYVSTLLTPEDAANLNASWTNFSATDLFVKDGTGYMLASPVNNIYQGVIMVQVDFESGTVLRNGSTPDVLYSIPKSTVPGIIQTGVATYDPLSFRSGIIFGDAIEMEPQFRLYATGDNVN